MLALNSSMYLLLTDKTNRAGILMIIYIYIKSIYENAIILHKLVFIFAVQLKIGIYPVYKA